MKTIALASGAALAAVLSPATAFAGGAPPPIIGRISVPHHDLDLATSAGAQAMLVRIEAAARDACGGFPRRSVTTDGLITALRREHHRCRIAAIDAATLRLDAPLVRVAWLDREASSEAREARRASAELLRAAGLEVPPELAAD